MGLEALRVDLADVVQRCRQNAKDNPKAQREREQLDADRRAEEVRIRVELASQIPPRFADISLGNLAIDGDNSSAIVAAKRIVSGGFCSGLGLFGRAGVGKSSVIAAIGNAAKAHGTPARVMRASTLIDRLRDARRFGGDENLADVRREFERTPVLGLNDIGAETVDRESLVWLHELLDARWESSRPPNGPWFPLYASSNLSLPQLVTHYASAAQRLGFEPVRGEAIVDRLRALTHAPWLEMTGPSRR